MPEFKTLQTMGLTDIDRISRYSLSQKDGQEILKVYFDRPDSSLQPNSHTFSFKRSATVAADGEAARKQAEHCGSDPVLMAAINELNQLSKKRDSQHDLRQRLTEDIDRLESVLQSKLDELRQDLKNIT
ncbi:DUF3461 family protein [Marinobacterium arenosum]|uniref:DUF3461 family protein n=1 Tax=Marinobacterium arenosum TaxID=2862496 RepID=UPI001C9693BF|nr:DUF3461 family protein [Marinobacterium arenosum]MBY4677168.1 DUF3461 family protein [Marinobacterium arenosum]